MTKVLVVTLSGPNNTYEDHYHVDTPFRWQGDKLEIFDKGNPVLKGQYNMTYVISLTVEEREPVIEDNTSEDRMLGDLP